MANRNYPNGGKQFQWHTKPVVIDCSFTVASSDSGGLGITGLKGGGVQNVFMHTSATPGTGNSNPATPNVAVVNPNPAAGTIVVQFQDNFFSTLGMEFSCASPNDTPVAITASAANLTVGVAYVITTLGDATAANWLAVGVPAGVTPAIGVAFIAKATGAGTGTTARVAPTAAAGSGIFIIEAVGSPGTTINPSPSANQGFGGQIILQCRDDSSTDASQIATPANGTTISLRFYMNESSVLVAGA